MPHRHIHCGQIITEKGVEGVAAIYNNHDTQEHHHKMFPDDESASNWLMSKGCEFKEIERAVETDDIEDLPEEIRKELPPMPSPEQMAEQMTKAMKQVKFVHESMDKVNLLQGEHYDQKSHQQFMDDAITNMIILSKYGLPVAPEELEAKVAEWARDGKAN